MQTGVLTLHKDCMLYLILGIFESDDLGAKIHILEGLRAVFVVVVPNNLFVAWGNGGPEWFYGAQEPTVGWG